VPPDPHGRTSSRRKAASLIYDAALSCGKQPVVVVYGSLQSGPEWRDRIGDPTAIVPRRCRVEGFHRVGTAFDAKQQPERPRIFVDRESHRLFRGHFAVLGIEKGGRMDAAWAPTGKEGFARVMESEFGYYPVVVPNTAVTDPLTGETLDESRVAITFVPFPQHRATFLENAGRGRDGMVEDNLCVRDGYLEKALEPLRRLGRLKDPAGRTVWDCLPELEQLFGLSRLAVHLKAGAERARSHVPPVGRFDLVAVKRNSKAFLHRVRTLDVTERQKAAVLALLTDEGLAAARPNLFGVREYLEVIVPQLTELGASENALAALDRAVAMREPLAA